MYAIDELNFKKKEHLIYERKMKNYEKSTAQENEKKSIDF